MTPQRKPASRWYKLIRIGQAHLAPGMNLYKWQTILADYLPPGTRQLDALTPAQIDEIIRRIGAEIKKV